MFDYKEYITKHANEYGSCPFWSWNDKLDEEELIRQIQAMKKAGFKGFFMHARNGLLTEYFSEEWFDCIKRCVKCAKEQGMEAWLYDENGWPSGFAGRKLLQKNENLSRYLKMERVNKYPSKAEESALEIDIMAIYSMRNNKPHLLKEADGSNEYIVIRSCSDASYVDTLNKEVTVQFLNETHEIYFKRFQDELGSEYMPGFFTDEPQYFRYATPWSTVLPTVFREKYGYDIETVLPALFLDFDGARELRYDYWKLCKELFIESWIKPVYEWCDNHGCKLTGHAIEESALFAQMWCCGGVMPFYEYQHIPGVDHLGRRIDPGLEAKQVGSVSAQLGKKRTLAEIFACCGCDVSPRELKRIADSMYVDGVNFICQHLYPYSLRGERKYDHPAHYSEGLPWFEKLKEFNEYFDRLGCILSLGEDATNVLVLHPMHSAYLDYRREEDAKSIRKLEQNFMKHLNMLWGAHVNFHLGDESLIARYGSVEGDRFKVGHCMYDVIIMPEMYSIDAATAELLERYMKAGGKFLSLGNTPEYLDGKKTTLQYFSNMTMRELIACQPAKVIYEKVNAEKLKYAIRSHGSRNILYLANLSDEAMKNIAIMGLKNPHILDLETMKFYPCKKGEDVAFLSLESCGSCCIIDDEEIRDDIQLRESKPVRCQNIDGDYQIQGDLNNILVMDLARYSYDGIHYSEVYPIPYIREKLLADRHVGKIHMRFKYQVSSLPETLFLAVEPQKFHSIKINGCLVDMYGSRNGLILYEARKNSFVGSNEIEICFEYYQKQDVFDVYFGNGKESLRNCLSFDTEIESVYLVGRFEVETQQNMFWEEDNHAICYDGIFAISEQGNMLKASDTVRNGYPFFYGVMKLTNCFTTESTVCKAKITGRYSVCDVSINGKHAGTCLFTDTVDISSFIQEGENEITLTVYSSTRNLFGPHHNQVAEPLSVFPNSFLYENQWSNGKCKDFDTRYAFVDFGVQVSILEY